MIFPISTAKVPLMGKSNFLSAFIFIGLWLLSGMPVIAEAVHADELFGISAQLDVSKSRERMLTALNSLGVSWVRTTAIWERFEPKPEQFDWKWFDGLVADAERHRIKLMVTVLAISPWGSTQLPSNYHRQGYQNVYPPRDLKPYDGFIRALAGRYQGKEIAWQIENEVNSIGTFWAGTRAEYLVLLRTAYAAAHEADPACVVLPAGLASPWPHTDRIEFRLERHKEWLDAILDSGAFDAIDMHNYQVPEENPVSKAFGISFEKYIETYQAWMKAKNAGVPLWISETGASSAPIEIESGRYSFTPEQQARDLERIYAGARARHVAHVFWLRLIDHEEGPFSHVGLSTAGRQPKPAAETYRRLATNG